jgi:probable phosphoglycerate mutase
VQTAAPLALRHGLASNVCPALREAHYGAWEGLTAAEAARRDPEIYARWLSDPEEAAPPAGEALAAVAARLEPAFRALAARHATEEIAVVAHNDINSVLLCCLLGLPLRRYRVFQQEPGAINRLLTEPTRTVIAGINDCCHLAREE